MAPTAKQFDPQAQFDQALDQADIEIQALRSTIDRLLWIKGKIADEFAAVQRDADTFATYTEAEAAAIFKIENDGTKTLNYAEDAFAKLRRRYNLPHCKVGKSILYTRQHLTEIAEILTIRQKKPAAKLKQAA